MSLNFFLTEPYLTLTINKFDDVIAFFALAGCGLLAAAFGRRRDSPKTLFAAEDETVRFGAPSMRLPQGGGRLTLQTQRGRVTLDLWEGDEQGFGRDESRMLALAASILGLGMR